MRGLLDELDSLGVINAGSLCAARGMLVRFTDDVFAGVRVTLMRREGRDTRDRSTFLASFVLNVCCSH